MKKVQYETYLQVWEDCEHGFKFGDQVKDFIVFGFHQYYPQGGLDDVVTSFDSFAEAKAFVETSYTLDKNNNKHWGYDYFKVVRKTDWAVVLEASVKHREISTT